MFRKRQIQNLIRSRFIQMLRRLVKTRNCKSTIPAWNSLGKFQICWLYFPPREEGVFGNRYVLVLWRPDTTWVHARSTVSALNLVSAPSDRTRWMQGFDTAIRCFCKLQNENVTEHGKQFWSVISICVFLQVSSTNFPRQKWMLHTMISRAENFLL